MDRLFLRAPALLAALLCAGCVYTGYLKLPSQGGPRWLQLSSEHFLISTDLGEAEARAQVQTLEDLRAGLVAAAWRGTTFPARQVHVVSFRRPEELHEFTPELVAGYWHVDWTGEKRLVLSWETDRTIHYLGMGGVAGTTLLMQVVPEQVAAHELTHELAAAYFARQPRWLAEGLAMFLQSIRIEKAQRVATVGLPPERPTPFHLPALGPVLRDEVLDHASAGWLVLFLVNRKGAAFGELQKALFRGDGAQAAFDRALPEYLGEAGLARLKADVEEFVRGDSFKTARVPFTPWTGSIEARPLAEEDVRVLRGALYADSFSGLLSPAEREAKARLDAEAALAARPGDAAALGLLVRLEHAREKRLALARQAVAAHPDEAVALVAVDMALGEEKGSDEEEALRRSSLQRARALAPDNVLVLERLGAALLLQGDLAGAEEASRAALRLLPDRPAALDTLAQVAAAKGNLASAATFEEMALEKLPDLPPAPDAEEAPWVRRARAMSRRLEGYRARAAPAR